jgi:aspartate kinase
MKVAKFGGTSVANAACITRVKNIIKADDEIKFVVVSAPGKREKDDTKITDLLYKCYDNVRYGTPVKEAFKPVAARFNAIVSELGVSIDLESEFESIRQHVSQDASCDYLVSRGEYLCAKIVACYLNWEFIDASRIVKFDEDGMFDSEKTNALASKLLSSVKNAVIPGFYGTTPDGSIKTFSRGGSDISGAIVARAVNASIYENWTDVDGFMRCDPRVVADSELIEMLTYKELRELSYMGANVLHPDSIFPVRKNDIPIVIRNTFNPQAKGTYIVPTTRFLNGIYVRKETFITGIAGKKDFVGIAIEKSMMNSELGFGRRILNVIENNGLAFEHIPSGIDTLTVILDGHKLSEDKIIKIVSEIENVCSPDSVHVIRDLALIAVVGHGLSFRPGAAAKVFGSLAAANVNIKMIDQGSSELNIIIAVENKDYEKALNALYDGLVRK